MPVKFLLDTHVWIWWHMRSENLSRKVKRTIRSVGADEELLLSAISVWEFCKLLEKGRLQISCSPEQWLEEALAMPKLRLVALSPAVSIQSTCLPQPFHDDPADQMIVATAREENATILTKDRRIRSYPHARSLW